MVKPSPQRKEQTIFSIFKASFWCQVAMASFKMRNRGPLYWSSSRDQPSYSCRVYSSIFCGTIYFSLAKMLKMTKCASAGSFLPTLLPSHREVGQRANSFQVNGLMLFNLLLLLLATILHTAFTEGWCLLHLRYSRAWWCWLWDVHSLGSKAMLRVLARSRFVYLAQVQMINTPQYFECENNTVDPKNDLETLIFQVIMGYIYLLSLLVTFSRQ